MWIGILDSALFHSFIKGAVGGHAFSADGNLNSYNIIYLDSLCVLNFRIGRETLDLP
jgi:hypothetical protein